MNTEIVKGFRVNWRHELLLDVTPHLSDKTTVFIYNISTYLPPEKSRERSNYLDKVVFTIKGNLLSVLIIDDYGVLNDESAKNLAVAVVKRNTTEYRLD